MRISVLISIVLSFFILERFKGTEYGAPAEIQRMMLEFDKNVKPVFKASDKKPYRISYNLHSRDDPKLKLKRGCPILTVYAPPS